MSQNRELAAVILAGGKASRLDFQDKALLELHGQCLIEHVLDKVRLQASTIVISSNRNTEKYSYLNLPTISDYRDPYSGPLIGICSAMRWLKSNKPNSSLNYLACLPGDVPHFPANICTTLLDVAREKNCEVVWVKHDEQIQPLFSLWSLDCLEKLESAIERGIYGPKLLFPELHGAELVLKKESSLDFFNINTAEELTIAKQMQF